MRTLRLEPLRKDRVEELASLALGEASPMEVFGADAGKAAAWSPDVASELIAMYRERRSEGEGFERSEILAVMLDERIVGAAHVSRQGVWSTTAHFWLGRAFRGYGLGRMTTEVVLSYVRGSAGVFRRLEAIIDPQNEGAARLLQSHGAIFDRSGPLLRATIALDRTASLENLVEVVTAMTSTDPGGHTVTEPTRQWVERHFSGLTRSSPPEVQAAAYYEAMLEHCRQPSPGGVEGQEHWSVHIGIAEQLAALGPPAVPYAYRLRHHKDELARMVGVGTFFMIDNSPELTNAVVRALDAASEPDDVVALMYAVGRARATAAIPALVKAMTNPPSEAVQKAALGAVGKIARKRFDKQPDPLAAAREWLQAKGYDLFTGGGPD